MTVNPHQPEGTVSPNSSEDAASCQPTPSTKLSAFTPNEIRESLQASGGGIVRSKVPPPFVLKIGQSAIKASGNGGQKTLVVPQDPFLSAPSSAALTMSSMNGSKLSPTASAFTPQDVRFQLTPASSVPDQMGFPVVNSFAHNGQTAGKTNLSNGHNDGRSYFIAVSPTKSTGKNAEKLFGPIVNEDQTFSTSNGASRSIMVFGLPRGISEGEVKSFFNPVSFSSLKVMCLTELSSKGVVYIQFGDIRDADNAMAKVRLQRPRWEPCYIETSSVVAKMQLDPSEHPVVSKFEGQVVVVAKGHAYLKGLEPEGLKGVVLQVLRQYGDVKALEVSSMNATAITFRAEYCHVDSTDPAISNIDGHTFAGVTLEIQPYKPGVIGQDEESSKHLGPLIIGQDDSGMEQTFKNMSLNDRNVAFGHGQPKGSPPKTLASYTPAGRSLTARKAEVGKHRPAPLNTGFNHPLMGPATIQATTLWSPATNVNANYSIRDPFFSPAFGPGAVGQERGKAGFSPTYSNPYSNGLGSGKPVISPTYSNPYSNGLGSGKPMLSPAYSNPYSPSAKGYHRSRGGHYNDHAQGSHNVVDVDRIRLGVDVRTTIMLRNIPNKIDQAMLKEIVDETSFGKYDFMYLRIDFANNCNVGYAFINFEDPYSIIEFVKARAGQRWNRFNSDKVAEVSYATIQGRDCLVQKFRNSSVMLEHPSFRPKIFFTGNGPLTGTEDMFPRPDNQSKMRRSVENAEHVGLFAPRAGQNFRNEQRRRRSQYDRGTRLAEMEDSHDMGFRSHNRAMFAPHPPFFGFGAPCF